MRFATRHPASRPAPAAQGHHVAAARHVSVLSMREATLDPVRESAEELSARDGYAAWAACYEEDGNPLMPLEGPAVAKLFGSVQGKRALDLGCGTGRHTLALA